MQLNLFTQNADKINEAEKLEADQEEQMKLDAVAQKFYPEILDAGPLGVKWRGEDVLDLTTAFAENYTPEFGFTCAECGGSGINAQPVNHHENCERKIK